ncbi:AAA family ATPase [Endozoicomonas sp. G2_1]|uniref:AAA family ATPase n=1 Tax=Endozoicomonas sp. G2_1 TaxID=2821091 RepID=UPI001ADA1241|nr:AAA family ATPase [Endozoicomonas sp. G2_1]MBO9492118.1 AAA family ATPase [Endozoicomonas sp. G2_1]
MNFAQEAAKLEQAKLSEQKVMDNPLQEFEVTLKSYGLEPNHIDVTGYGTFKRIPSNVGGKRSKDSGWYWLEQAGDTMFACYGDWHVGDNNYWQSSNAKRLSPDERKALDERIARTKALHQQHLEQLRDKAAEKAATLLNQLEDANTKHQYLRDKGASVYKGVKTDGKFLYIPVYIQNQIRSYQKIDAKGNKQFLYESETKGGYFWIAGTTSTDIYLAEGYSTGDTVHRATGASVLVCFNASNMYEVLLHFRTIDKDTPVTIAADNDHHNNDKKCGNTGLIYAEKCVEDFAGVRMHYPENIKGTDFNDMEQELGLSQVKRVLNSYVPRFDILPVHDMDIKPTDWLIKNILPNVNLGLLYGASGHMKSFLVFDMALSIAAGIDWHGNKVKEPKSVLYICGEGFSAITKRYKAWVHAKQITEKLPFFMTNKAVHFLDEGQRFDVLSDLTYFMAQNGQKEYPALIIIDTLNRNFGDGDENSTQDMTNFVAGCDELHHKTGSMIFIVHHSGKGELATARGSSALRASLDVEYQVTMKNIEEFEAGIQPANIELKCTKMKDAEAPKSMLFEHESVNIPNVFDEDGEPVSSVVLHPISSQKVNSSEIRNLIDQDVAFNAKAKNNKTDFALLAIKDALINTAAGMLGKSNQKAGVFVQVPIDDVTTRYRAICEREKLDMSSMRKLKSRAIDSLVDMKFIDALGSNTHYVISNKEVIKKINQIIDERFN